MKYILEYTVREDDRKKRFAAKDDMRILNLTTREVVDVTLLSQGEQKAINDFIDDFVDPEWSNFRIIDLGVHELLIDTEPEEVIPQKFRL